MIPLALTLTSPDLNVSLKGIGALAVMSIGLAAGAAALMIKGWGRSAVKAGLGGLVYGLAPLLIGFAVGGLTLGRAFIAPLTFAVWDEVLIRQRFRFWLAGPVLGILAALSPPRTLDLLLPVAAASVVALVVVAMFLPGSMSEYWPNAIKVFALAVPAFFLVLAFPLSVQISDPRHLSASISDNHTVLTAAVNTIVDALHSHQSVVPVVLYLMAGVAAAILVTVLKGLRLSWTIVPIVAVAVVALVALVPRFSTALLGR